MKKALIKRIVDIYKEYGFFTILILAHNLFIAECMRMFPEARRILVPKIYSVAIEPTNSCNLHCKMCYSQRPSLHHPREKGYMNFNLYKRIIDELSGLNRIINLGLNFGGESLLHKHFIEMFEYASSKKRFRISFSTNGMLLNNEVSQALVKNRIDSVSISLDGLRTVHESIREGSNYDVVEKNILELVKLRGSNMRPKIIVNVTDDSQSRSQMQEFIEYWIAAVDFVDISPCLNENSQFIHQEEFFDRG